MPRLLPLAVAQVPPVALTGSRLNFADQVTALVDDFPNTRLAIYPELHLFGVDGLLAERNAALRAAAEPLDGPSVKLLGELAGDLGVWLMPGTVCELGENGALYKHRRGVVPDRGLVASYRKCFPWRPYEPYLPGDRFVVFDLPVGRIDVSICYDAWFPEVARHLAWMGAGVIVNPTQTTTCDRDQEVVLARANAITNQVFVPTVLTDVLDLDDVTRVRTFGTAGLNRTWDQFRDADEPLELPLYQGRMNPKRWRPTSSG